MVDVIHVAPDDEIADVIERVRGTDADVALVLPRGSRALQTPLNARLLSQYAKQHGHTTSIVSEEPRVQELARQHGFPVYGSVPAYERGLDVGAMGGAAASTYRSTTSGAFASAAPAAVDEAPAIVGTPPGTPGSHGPSVPLGAARVAAATATANVPPATRRPITVPPAAGGAAKTPGHRNRRALYIAAGAVAVVGLLLFFLLAPSATVTITVAGTQLTVNPTIQGSTDPNAAHQGDHVATAVVNASASNSFDASPTGSQTLPATPANGSLQFSTNLNYIPHSPWKFTISKGNTFQTGDGAQVFVATQETQICIYPNGQPQPTTSDCGGQPPNNSAPVQAQSTGAATNVPASSVTKWDPASEDPCNSNPECTTGFGSQCSDPSGQCDIFVTNGQAMSGGADQKQVTVVSDSDVSSWNSQVTQIENTLTAQLNQQIQGKSGGKSFAVDPGGGGKSITFNVTPQLPTPGTQFSATKVTIAGQASAVLYDPADVRNDVLADLQSKVAQGDQLAPNKLSMQPCQVTQAAVDGTVVLSCSATDFAQPIVDLPGLKSRLAGKNPGSAEKIIDGAIDKVRSVRVSEFPFKLFYLPLFSSRIEIDENFVAQPSSGP
jgi:hypothetical protein